MESLNFKLGIITNVDVQNRKINIVDTTTSNITSENYQNIYFADIPEHQVIPQVGYYVLFCVICSIPGRQDVIIPIKYFSSKINGDNQGSIKSCYFDFLQSQGDQVFASKGGTSVGIQNQAVVINAGSQTLTLNNSTSETILKYDSLKILGRDGVTITQEQDSNTLKIEKGNTSIILDGDNVNIVSGNINLNAKNIIVGDENTIKGQSLLQWLNQHQHKVDTSGGSGVTTQLISPAQDTLLVKEQ